MKKIILTTATIAVGFAGLAFNATAKNQALDAIEILQNEVVALDSRCESKMETDVKFSKCNTSWTEDSAQLPNSSTLEKY